MKGVLATAVPSRQVAERIPLDFGVARVLAKNTSKTSRARRAQGYDAIVGMVTGTAAFTVEILGAPAVPNKQGGLEQPGTFVLLETIASTADAESGGEVAQIDRQVRSTFVKVRVTAGSSKVEEIQHTIELIPIYGFRRVDVVAGSVTVNPTPNRPSFATGVKDVASHGTAQQLQSQAIPDGFGLVIRAKGGNQGVIFYGNSKANAEDHTVAAQLSPDDFIKLYITNVDLVFIDAANDGEGVTWTVET